MPYNQRYEFMMIFGKMLSVGAPWPFLYNPFLVLTAHNFSGDPRRKYCLGQMRSCCLGY